MTGARLLSAGKCTRKIKVLRDTVENTVSYVESSVDVE